MNDASEESGLECKDPTLTQQQFAEEVDINTIVDRFKISGEVPQLAKLPSYGDFTGIFDFQTAQNAVVEANRAFMSMPAKLRTRFENDPHQFVEFFANPDNLEEAIQLGLVKAPAAPAEPEVLQGKQAATVVQDQK